MVKIFEGSIKVMRDNGVLGQWFGYWEGHDPSGKHQAPRLDELSWEYREGLRDAATDFMLRLDGIDRDEAVAKQGRHEGHHTHFRGGRTSCSCGVNMGVISFVPDEDAENRVPQCTECGQLGVWKLSVDD